VPALPDVAALLAAPVAPAAPKVNPASIYLEGVIGRITIFDLLQTVEDNRITGRLVVRSNGRDGTIHFDAGTIVGSELSDGASGQDALKVLFTIETGAFVVEYTDRPASDQFHSRSNTGLLVDVLRVIEEERRGITPG
jgi:hypothetical protein